MSFYQVVKRIPQDDGTIREYPTMEIYSEKEFAEEFAKMKESGITKFVKKITKKEFNKFLRDNITTDGEHKIKIYPHNETSEIGKEKV